MVSRLGRHGSRGVSTCSPSNYDAVHPVSVRRFPSFRTQPLENLTPLPMTSIFLSNPAPGENLLSGNLVMETGCILHPAGGGQKRAPTATQRRDQAAFPELRTSESEGVAGLCFWKSERAGGSLGKIWSFSPVLLRHGIGQVRYGRRQKGKHQCWKQSLVMLIISCSIIYGRVPNNVGSQGTVLGEPPAIELSYQLSYPSSIW